MDQHAREPERLTPEELDAESATALPSKEVLSLVDLNADVDLALDLAAPIDLAAAANLNVAAPIDAGAAANVLSIGSQAGALSEQAVLIDQHLSGDAIATAPQDSSIDQSNDVIESPDTPPPTTDDGSVAVGDLALRRLVAERERRHRRRRRRGSADRRCSGGEREHRRTDRRRSRGERWLGCIRGDRGLSPDGDNQPGSRRRRRRRHRGPDLRNHPVRTSPWRSSRTHRRRPSRRRRCERPASELLGTFEGSGYREPPALVRCSGGQTIQVTALLYQLLEAIDGQRTIAELAAEVSERTGRDRQSRGRRASPREQARPARARRS